LQTAVAIALIAATVTWTPTMLVGMTRMPHAGHHSGAPASHHDPHALQCCDLCPPTCATASAIPGAPPRVASPTRSAPRAPLARGQWAPRSTSQHRLPFPLGPPTLRLA
jgi:hypothetical protein